MGQIQEREVRCPREPLCRNTASYRLKYESISLPPRR